MFNQRRTRSAYLDNNNGEIKSIEPDGAKYKMKKKMESHKKDVKLTGKKIILLILFIICFVLFFKYLTIMINPLCVNMHKKTSHYEINTKVNDALMNINLPTKKELDMIKANMTALISSVNTYNKELSSIYDTIKSTITIYSNGKEDYYNTQKLFDATIERIDLDISLVNNDMSLKYYKTLQNAYLQRFENLKLFLEKGVNYNSSILVNDFNTLIVSENELYNTCLNSIKSILNQNNFTYKFKDQTVSFN